MLIIYMYIVIMLIYYIHMRQYCYNAYENKYILGIYHNMHFSKGLLYQLQRLIIE